MRRHPVQLLLIAALIIAVFFGVQSVGKLRATREQLADSNRELERIRQELKDLKAEGVTRNARQPVIDSAAELELARLRNEVTRLRAEQKAAALRPAPVAPAPGPAGATPTPAPRTEIHSVSAEVSATVGLGHALAVGGWESAKPGRRVIGLMVPEASPETPGAVTLTTRLIELPDAALDALGLQGLRTAQTNQSGTGSLTPEQWKELLAKAGQLEGVETIATPRILTANGQAAKLSIGQENSAGVHLGTQISVTPTLDPAGTAVRLDLHLELNQERPPKP